ncbi:MAG: T9SS type A sorting domain-containing protein [bacterium]
MGGTYDTIAIVAANVTTYQNTGLDSQTTYYYRVLAYNAAGESGYSNEANATTLEVPNAPTNLTAVAVSTSRIDLSWTDNSTIELGFYLERKVGAGGTYTQIATLGINVTTYQDMPLAAQTTYYYRVKAYNAAGESGYSNEVNATTFAGLEAGKIAFVSDRDGNAEIYVMNADGQDQSNLTNNLAEDRAPAISPDGYQIVFASYRSGNNYEIYLMTSSGLNPVRLTNNSADDNYPVFSPDGNYIAFESARDGNYEIYLMNINGSVQSNLTNNAFWDRHPTFSPDGTQIAFASMRDGDYEIWVMDVDGSNPTKLTNNLATDYYPAFGPDGRIAFVSTRDGNEEIYVMNPDGSGQTRLTANPAHDRYPCFSPDGSQITFATDRDGGGDRIYMMDSDGTGQVPLTVHPSDNYDPYWGTGRAPDTTPPAAFDLLSPANGSQVDTTSPILTWEASSDTESNLAGYDLYMDGELNKSVEAAITSTTPASPLSVGQHEWYVNARNNAGLTTRSTSIFTFKTDDDPPVTSMALSAPNYENYYVTSATTFTLSAVDTGSGVASTLYQINGQGWLSYTTAFTLAGRNEGVHTIKYYSTDKAGNVEATKSLTVYLDNTSPTTTITVSDPKVVMGNITYVGLNNTFTLSAIDTPSAGVALTEYRIDAGGWKTYVSAFSLQSEGITTEGAHTIEYRSRDNLQNIEGTKSLAVYLDQTPPATSLAVSTPKYIRDKIYVTPATTFSMAAADTGVGVASTVYRIDGGGWISYTTPFSLTGQTEGNHLIEYRSTDSLQQIEAVKQLSVYLDQTAPSSSVAVAEPKYIMGNKAYVGASSSLTITVTEDGSGTASTLYQIDSGNWKSYTTAFSLQSEGILTEGDHTLQYYSTDNLENTEAIRSLNIYLDQTGPTTLLVPSGPNYQAVDTLYITSATGFTLMAEDLGAGVASTLYRIDGQPWTSYSKTFSLDMPGDHIIYYQSTDYLGNREDTKSLAVYLDETPPVTSLNVTGPQYTGSTYVTSAARFSLDVVDTGVSVDTIRYRIDGVTDWTDYQSPFSLADGLADGNYTISYYSTDYLGNTETTNSQSVYLDNTPPATTDNAPSDWSNTPVTINLSSTDTGAGVAATRYSTDGISWDTGTAVSLMASGIYTLRYYSTDHLGHQEQTHQTEVKIDLTAPNEFDLLSPANGDWIDSPSPVFTWLPTTNGESGMAGYDLYLDGALNKSVEAQTTSTQLNGTMSQGSHTWYVIARNNAGDTMASNSVFEIRLDTTSPQPVAWVNDGPGEDIDLTSSTHQLSANWAAANDGVGSGIRAYLYALGITPGGTEVVGWTDNGSDTHVTVNGLSLVPGKTYYFSVKTRDGVRLESASTYSDGIMVESTPPLAFDLLSPVDGLWLDSVPSLSWEASADHESGMVGYDLLIDDRRDQTVSSDVTETKPAVELTEGRHDWYVRAKNGVGLETASNDTFSFGLDFTPPASKIIVSDPAFPIGQVTYVTSTNTFSLSAVDTGSGVKAIRYRLDGEGWNAYEEKPFSVEIAGLHTIGYQSEDTVGHWEVEKILDIYVDDTPPTVELIITGPEYSPNGVKYVASTTSLSFSETDGAGVGVDLTEYRLDGGAWTTYTGSFTLAGKDEDTHLLEYRSADKLGNQTGMATATLYLDHTPPTTTDNAPLDWSNTPVTVDLSPADTGAGVAATRYSTDGISWDTGTEISLTASGIHTLQYYSIDRLGHQEQTNQKEVKIDLTAPVGFNLLSPANGDWTDSRSPVFSWQETTNGESGMAGYDLYLDGVRNKSVEAQTTFTQLEGTITEGSHTWYVVAINNAGDTMSSNSVFEIRLDTTPPGPVAWVSDGLVSETELSANWAAADDGEGSGIAAYLYAIGTMPGGTDLVNWKNNGADTSVTESGLFLLSEETYYFTVKAQDVVGLESDPVFSDGVKLDSTPPLAFDLVSPANGTWTNNPQPTLSWQSSSDPESGLAGYSLFIDGSRVQTGIQTTQTAPPQALTPGPHTWYVEAVNKADGVRNSSSIYTINIDPTPPLGFDLASPANGSWTNNPQPTLSWQPSSDPESGMAGYNLFIDGSQVGTGIQTTQATPSQALVPGAHTWYVRAVNKAEGVTNSNSIYTINIDPTPPLAFDLSSPANGSWTNNPQPTLSWQSSSDPESEIAGYSLFIDGSQIATDIPTPQTTPSQVLAPGAHTWYVDAVNKAGGVKRSDSTYSINIDTAPPTVSLAVLPENSRSNFVITWSGTDNASGIASYRLEYKKGIGPWQTLISTTADTSYEFTGSLYHTYSFRVRAVDAAGNTGAYSEERSTTITILGYSEWMVAANGESISLEGRGTVTVPANVLDTDTYVHVDSLDTPTEMIYYHKIKGVDNPSLRIALDKGVFVGDIRVTILYQEDKVSNEENLRMYHYHETTEAWELVSGSWVDTEANTVTAETKDTGEFRLVEYGVTPESLGTISEVSNYPNPFLPSEETTIVYHLKKDTKVTIRIYDLLGHLVKEFEFSAGEEGGKEGPNEVPWDGRNGEGNLVEAGAYLCYIEAGGDDVVRKIMVR